MLNLLHAATAAVNRKDMSAGLHYAEEAEKIMCTWDKHSLAGHLIKKVAWCKAKLKEMAPKSYFD